MKRFIILLLALCCITAACGGPDPSETIAVPTVPETELQTEAPTEAIAVSTVPETEHQTEAPTEISDTPATLPVVTVAPLPVTVDIHNLENCTVAVSLERGGAKYGSDGTGQMEFTVYTYDLYDLVDISRLGGGDTILLRGEPVVIEALERTDSGAVVINGGLDMGGHELWTDEGTVYYETGYSDIKSWYELGKVSLTVAEGFVFTDRSDLDGGPVTYSFDDLASESEALDFVFDPQGTTLTIENGVVISMERVYTP